MRRYTAATDPRVKTAVILNSGFQPDGMCGLSGPLACSRALIPGLNGPVIFISGGPTDVAHNNSIANYNLATVPAVLAFHATAGHSGFYGSASRTVQLQAIRAVVEWLDGTLNGDAEALQFLTGPGGLAADEWLDGPVEGLLKFDAATMERSQHMHRAGLAALARLVSFALVVIALAAPVGAATEVTSGVLPDGTPYRIDYPDNWNGTLLVSLDYAPNWRYPGDQRRAAPARLRDIRRHPRRHGLVGR